MAVRFRKSIKLAPGIRWNISGSGSSWTFGPRGASISVGKRGTYLNTGIPGTGLYARQRIDNPAVRTASSTTRPSVQPTTSVSMTCGISDDGTLSFTDANGSAVAERLVEVAKKQNREAIQGLIQTKCDEINSQVEVLGRLHHDTPDCRTAPKFQAPPFDLASPTLPRPQVLGFFDKLFKSRAERITAANAASASNYEANRQAWLKTKAEFDTKVAERRDFVESLIYTDIASMERFLEESLQDIAWPRETSIDFEINDGGAAVLLNVDLPELEDMPTKLAAVPSRGLKLSVKEMPASKVQKLYSDHVHSVAFRLVGEVFAALPTAQSVTFSGYSQRRDKGTGQLSDEYLISARCHRTAWESIDFKGLEFVDPAQALSRFELIRDQLRSGVFKAIVQHQHDV